MDSSMSSPTQIRDRIRFTYESQPRGSTSQLYLHKILHIIATVPPPPPFPPTTTTTQPEDFIIINHENGFGQLEKKEPKVEEAENSLILLNEAAKLIFGEFIDNDYKFDSVVEKKDEVAAETTPELVVRSKRGRTRVLPNKYRDSVLQPLTRSSVVSNKRSRR